MKKHVLLFTLRSFFFYLFFSVLSAITRNKIHYFYFYRGNASFWNSQMASSVGFVFTVLMLLSVASVFCLNNNRLRQDFAETNGGVKLFQFAITSKYLWIEFLALSVFGAIFFSLTPICTELFSGFLANVSARFVLKKILSICIATTIIFATLLLAMVLTLGWWREKRLSGKEKNKTGLEFAKELAITAIAWFLASLTVTSIFPAIITTAIVAAMMWDILLAAIVILSALSFLIFYLRATKQRRNTIKNIERLSKEQGFEFSVVGHPYRSIIRPDESYHMLIKMGEVKLACKFMSARSKKRALYLADSGFAIYEKKRFFYTRHVMTRYFFDADEDARKIIIFSPCRSRMFRIRSMETREKDIPNDGVKKIIKFSPLQRMIFNIVDTSSAAIDVGDKCNGYELYNTSGFINAIDRKCI